MINKQTITMTTNHDFKYGRARWKRCDMLMTMYDGWMDGRMEIISLIFSEGVVGYLLSTVFVKLFCGEQSASRYDEVSKRS